MSIGKIQQYWIDYMNSNADIQNIFVRIDAFNIEMYFTRENEEVKIKTVHN